MSRRMVVGDLRVQRIDRRGGQRSWTIVWPAGTVHEEADRFLREARHTLATNLLRNGATLTHIRRYLGQVSDRMAEHYVNLSHSDLEDILQQVWVAGPGTASPGELLAGEAAPLSREQAVALAIDLSRRSTPAEAGSSTSQVGRAAGK